MFSNQQRFIVPVLCAIALIAQSAWAINTDQKVAPVAAADEQEAPDQYAVQESASQSGRLKIAVLRYALNPAANKLDVNVSYNRHDGVIIESTSKAGDLGTVLADAVSTELTRTGRFEVYDRTHLETLLHEAGQATDGLLNQATILRVAREAGLHYVVYGDIESASSNITHFDKEETKNGKKRTTVSYNADVSVTIHHVAVDVETGQIWKEMHLHDSRQAEYHYERPGASKIRDMFRRASVPTAHKFVRQLVPAREAKVAGKNAQYVVVNMGRADGVGLDTDMVFYRLAPVLNAKGEAIKDPDSGEALFSKAVISARPSTKHKDPLPCIGRPVQVEEHFSLVEVGYNGAGGFLGLSIKLKPSLYSFAAIQPGDLAVLVPRAGK